MSLVVLPSTVEEINYMQSTQSMYAKSEINKGFENIATTGYKREVSLPEGVNWNVVDFDCYLNFEENAPGNHFKAIQSHDDCIVPGEGELRQRSESLSSVTSSMDDKNLVYHNLAVKTFSTVCMDSGSTCISSEHSYVSPSPPVYKGLDDEETYQNLSTYLKGPEVHPTDSLSSISQVSSPANDNSNLEYSSVLNTFSMISNCSQDGFSEISVGSKRSADTSDDDLFLMTSVKRSCESPNGSRYHEIRKKNNIASKNCRKTRKEKQKEMEVRVAELEKEREELTRNIEYLETMIKSHHVTLCTILNNRQPAV